MIAKHVPMKVAEKGGFASLLAYLSDAQAKRERVGCVTVTNCQSDQALVAITEILNTQAQNQRALSDKTYHLILSFPAGEEPAPAVLQAVEARICQGLGYGAHQRISVVHHDTDNLHVHIAINKIHPTRYTIHQPYRDHATLGQLCAALEDEFGLRHDNHQARQTGAASRAMDMERQAGVESVLGLVRRECHAQMRDAASWQELHGVLLVQGLALRERGNGLVIVAADGTAVKASSVHRDCSKARLETRLGPFVPGPAGVEDGRGTYARRPLRLGVPTNALYARYQEQQHDAASVSTGMLAGARARHKRLIAEAKRTGRLKRAAIRMIACGPLAKRILYAAVSKTLAADIARINGNYLAERRAIRSQHGRMAWADWLRTRAQAGDAQALAALRARGAGQGLNGNTLAGSPLADTQNRPLPPGGLRHDSVTKQGTLIYCAGATTIRDDGHKLKITRGATQAGLMLALDMAVARYGRCLHIGGSAAFQDQVIQAAAAAHLAFTFDDPVLERRRQDLLRAQGTKENHDGEAGSPRQGAQPGTSAARGAAGAGAGDDRARATAVAADAKTRRASASGPGSEPDPGGPGRHPPPAARHRLRELPQLGMVRIKSGTEVLLPRDVPGHVEQQPAAADQRVRRHVPGRRSIADKRISTSTLASAAVEAFLLEREQTTPGLSDISKFERYDGVKGRAVFAGLHDAGGQMLALLKRGEATMVLPVSETAAKRLRKLSPGDAVTVTPNGVIKTKGRTR